MSHATRELAVAAAELLDGSISPEERIRLKREQRAARKLEREKDAKAELERQRVTQRSLSTDMRPRLVTPTGKIPARTV